MSTRAQAKPALREGGSVHGMRHDFWMRSGPERCEKERQLDGRQLALTKQDELVVSRKMSSLSDANDRSSQSYWTRYCANVEDL
jgi:hypothetical protein